MKREFTGVFIPAHIWISKLLPAEKMLLGEVAALSLTTGWCTASRDHFAEWLHCDVTNVTHYVKKLERLGYLEVSRNPGYRSKMRVKTDAFFVGEVVNGVHGGSERGSRVVVNGVHGGSERGSPEIKGKYNTEIKDEIQLSPQAALVTLHTPDQIENTFVHVVEQISLEEEKTKIKTSSAGPYENKETPALQNAGHFEAEVLSNNPPPTFLNPELRRRYEKGKPPTEKTGKPRKAQAADRSAEVCAEMKTEKDVGFFHAIHAAWGEWIDYKRREKKGTYKTAKTEAATITALARTVNYDPVAGRAAIEHSIAHTYQGIYPPKDGAPAKQAAERYSLEDCPQAKTPEEMRGEISRFYNANKSRFDELQRIAETNYGPDRLRSIVTDFCGNRISKSRQGETFGQHHAALGAWLKRQKEFDAKNEAPKHAGPQGRQLFSAAPVNYSLD